MQYDSSKIDALVDSLSTYHDQLLSQHNDIRDTAKRLLSEAWESGDDQGASATFDQKNNILLGDLEDLIATLKKGNESVVTAYQNASGADSKVAKSFVD